MNIGVHVSVSLLVSSGWYAQQWDCWVVWQFYSQFFKESPLCSPQWLYQFAFPPTVEEGSLFSTPSPAFIVCRLFDDGHSDMCERTPHCGFDLQFSNNEWRSASLHVFGSHWYVWRNVCLGLLSTFYGVVPFSGIELHELLVYFGDSFFVSCFISYYFLLFWRLSFRLPYSFLRCAKAFK